MWELGGEGGGGGPLYTSPLTVRQLASELRELQAETGMSTRSLDSLLRMMRVGLPPGNYCPPNMRVLNSIANSAPPPATPARVTEVAGSVHGASAAPDGRAPGRARERGEAEAAAKAK